ncbi:MAG TPA: UDP-N-acetylglucosamine 2-epimerase [Chthoniobacteraceae bacterium]|jgi:UDP-hydrolysing UDP-N-acetyl-D-glucosamine 2-epimerase|nr:UDP-N-acetylglucosamine 2-epimerase [Chthoniobacteraceae bacterium]
MSKRSIGVVTVARSDFGIYRSLLRAISDDPNVELRIYASGTHLSEAFGETVREIEAAGYAVAERVPVLTGDDSPAGVAAAIARGVGSFAEIFARSAPDVLVVLGDRFDMFAAAVASIPFNIPLAHIHGGEVTEGAIDDGMRHAITKLAHLHFPAAEPFAARLRQMGEEPWRITMVGAPALDGLDEMKLMSRDELEKRFDIDLIDPPLLVTFHPVTRQPGDTEAQIAELLKALEKSRSPIIFTAPNADTHGQMVRKAIEAFIAREKRARLIENFGQPGYFSMLTQAKAMVGNSSSGIIEAASFHLPVVNVGDRQKGRAHGFNVIDCPCIAAEIEVAIREATSRTFRREIADRTNPYRPLNRDAAPVILEKLRTVPLVERLLIKRFIDLPAA